MKADTESTRKKLIDTILSRQDNVYRWGFDEKKAHEKPQYIYYSPNFKSTLWTLILLADLKAPPSPPVHHALKLISNHFYHPQTGVFSLPDKSYFPLPCLNGNMIYLHHQFQIPHPGITALTIPFFAAYQRFDDSGFKTPADYPYCSNTSCYGKHTCYWGVIKLFKGLSFIPEAQRTDQSRGLMAKCIDFILLHQVCYRSRRPESFLHRDIDKLTFPAFYRSDFLEILWLLSREKIRDPRLTRALRLLQSKINQDNAWDLEKSMNTIVSTGEKGRSHPFITERAREVLNFHNR